MENPPKPSSDFDELAAIHKHLFQDIYAWAGAFRTVNIRKNVDGADAFAHLGKLQLNVQHAETQLRQDAFLQGLNRAQIVEQIAYHYDQFNFEMNDHACRVAGTTGNVGPLVELFD